MTADREFGGPLKHPLGWGDRELKFLVDQGLDQSNLYRSMGYKLKKGNSVPASFKTRIKRLSEGEG